MTLVCECGGSLEITHQQYDRDADGNITGEGQAYEEYRCMSCGRTGSYTFGDGGEHMTGCLTVKRERYA